MKLSDKVDQIEKALITHLTESGEIRTDIKNVKNEIKDLRKIIYWLVGGGVFINLVSHLWR